MLLLSLLLILNQFTWFHMLNELYQVILEADFSWDFWDIIQFSLDAFLKIKWWKKILPLFLQLVNDDLKIHLSCSWITLYNDLQELMLMKLIFANLTIISGLMSINLNFQEKMTNPTSSSFIFLLADIMRWHYSFAQ